MNFHLRLPETAHLHPLARACLPACACARVVHACHRLMQEVQDSTDEEPEMGGEDEDGEVSGDD